ncbi:AAA family ATPase, partial [bacterium]|nr:AAA family ATPase [bacterium]
MYERFFGLDELPFQLTPDPRYLFLSSKHREALGHLVYGIREGAGFVCITGEIGAGKTTLLRALLREADDSTKYAYILNPVLTGVELLEEINHELGAESTGTRRELLAALNRVLVEQRALGRRVVLVVDEAQSLDGGILEQLRLLSNFETESAKLLQVVLVGQPELRQLLARPELEQLNQRITVRWHLGRMDRAETAQYLAHRVRTAGQTRGLFDKGAIAVIHEHARGTPRLINVTAHRALMVAYAESSPEVTRAIARRAVG